MPCVLKFPIDLGQKSFWILCWIKSFDVRNENIGLRRQEVDTFKGTVSSEIGRKLAG